MNRFENYLDLDNLRNTLYLNVGGADTNEERTVSVRTYSEWKNDIVNELKGREKNDLLDYKKYIEYKRHSAQYRKDYYLPLFSIIYPLIFSILVLFTEESVLLETIYLAFLLVAAIVVTKVLSKDNKKFDDDVFFYDELLEIIEEIISEKTSE